MVNILLIISIKKWSVKKNICKKDAIIHHER